jgi:hypothetical protein
MEINSYYKALKDFHKAAQLYIEDGNTQGYQKNDGANKST